MQSPLKYIVRLLSFFAKEINEVRRQPRLILSLLLGPFLILLLFGAGYRGSQPVLRTTIVLPPAARAELSEADIQRIGGTNFVLTGIESEPQAAVDQLRRGDTDVVQIMPADIEAQVRAGKQSTVEFTYDQINPVNEQWIQYLGYAQVVEMNKAILGQAAGASQEEARGAQADLADTRQQLDAAQSGLDAVGSEQLRASLARLRRASGLLAAGSVLAGAEDAARARDEIDMLQQDIDALDGALADGRLDQERARVDATRERIGRVEELSSAFASLPPEVLVSPLRQGFTNLNGRSLDLMTYYAPSVLALLIQHIAVTLGSLSLVHERLRGATEFFRVAPVSASQMLLGKYLGYTLFIAIIIAALVGLMLLLGVPFLGDPLQFVWLSLLLTVASLGVGLFISAISRSDSQAVQLSMLVLLLSIFFSGFFLPLENFLPPLQVVSAMLPISHGISGFHSLLLRGAAPSQLAWVALSCIAAATAAGALILTLRSFRQVLEV